VLNRTFLLFITLGAVLVSAGGSGIDLTPDSTELRIRETKTFRVTTPGLSPRKLIWKVVSTATSYTGELGIIDSNGVYTAPAVLPFPNTVVVRAQDPASSYVFGTAAVTLLNATP
jgi:hypothetical protein